MELILRDLRELIVDLLVDCFALSSVIAWMEDL
jgi:hypothetical protein